MQQTMACEISLVHVSVERQIRELYQYPVEKPMIQFFRDHPDLSFAMCLKMEETILAAVAIYQSTLHTIKDRNQWAPVDPGLGVDVIESVLGAPVLDVQ